MLKYTSACPWATLLFATNFAFNRQWCPVYAQSVYGRLVLQQLCRMVHNLSIDNLLSQQFSVDVEEETIAWRREALKEEALGDLP